MVEPLETKSFSFCFVLGFSMLKSSVFAGSSSYKPKPGLKKSSSSSSIPPEDRDCAYLGGCRSGKIFFVFCFLFFVFCFLCVMFVLLFIVVFIVCQI